MRHKDDTEAEEFKLELVEEGGRPVFRGMPEVMKKFLIGFDANEIR